MSSDRGPLAGRRIIEVGHMLAGPYCGMLLADLGAEVIKVEGAEGDIARQVSPHQVGPHNAYFASLNRGKRSVVLDLASADGQSDLRALVRDADGLITNLRPSAIKKLGLTYAALRAVNPKLVCVALTGYGLDGPFADQPAYDYVIQALAGVMALTGDPGGPPMKIGYSAVDNSAGIMAALGMVAKIAQGCGGQVDVSLHDTLLSQLNYLAAGYLNAGERPMREPGGGHPYIVPAQVFATGDGYLALFISHDRFWRAFAAEVGRPQWLSDPRFATMAGRAANRTVVVDAVAEILRAGDAASWVERLAPLGVVVAGVQELPEALDGALVASREMVVSIPVDGAVLRVLGSPIKIDGYTPNYTAPPLLNEHGAPVDAA